MKAYRNLNLRLMMAFIFVFLSVESKIYGIQDTTNSKPSSYWFSLGLGMSVFSNNAGISGGGSFSLDYEKYFITIRYIENIEFVILGPSSESVWDLGVLYGQCSKTSYGKVSIAGGIAIVGGFNRGEYIHGSGWFSSRYEKVGFTSIGIPVEAQLLWTPFPFFGVGINGFANINFEKSIAGALLCLQIIY